MDRLGGGFPHDLSDDHFDDEMDSDDFAIDPPLSPVGQDERRMQVRAYNHWAAQLGNRNFPATEDLNPDALTDFGPFSVLLDFSGGIEDPAIRYLGSQLAQECGADDAIIRLSDVPTRSLLSRITDHYMQILANQSPIGFEAEFVNQHGRTALYRGILLPYSSDDRAIDHIYGVINWKEVADQQTTDALLLEIDQALTMNGEGAVGPTSVELPAIAATPTAHRELATVGDDAVLDLATLTGAIAQGDDMPLPTFGQDDWESADYETDYGDAVGDDYDDEDYAAREDAFAAMPLIVPEQGARADRVHDALGNPIGHLAAAAYDHSEYPDGGDAEPFDNPIKTAADYGLPDFDEEPEDDVYDLIDPLADPDVTSTLSSLVNRSDRIKKTVDLSVSTPPAAIPQAYDGEGITLPDRNLAPRIADHGADTDDVDMPAVFAPLTVEHIGTPEPAPTVIEIASEASDDDDVAIVEAPAPLFESTGQEGLYDCLASAREMAQTALNTEDRSRKALYAAMGRAYDFSLEAQASPTDFEELMADNGLTMQDRAPMTPVVKLVFGAEYDKTRLTEYAAVLTHAHRLSLGRGALAEFLRTAEGGLKGVVNAERQARKLEQGKPVEETSGGIRAALAARLRKIEPVAFGDLPVDGAEFALVMVRRAPGGELIVLGEIPVDVPLIEKAARKLLG